MKECQLAFAKLRHGATADLEGLDSWMGSHWPMGSSARRKKAQDLRGSLFWTVSHIFSAGNWSKRHQIPDVQVPTLMFTSQKSSSGGFLEERCICFIIEFESTLGARAGMNDGKIIK